MPKRIRQNNKERLQRAKRVIELRTLGYNYVMIRETIEKEFNINYSTKQVYTDYEFGMQEVAAENKEKLHELRALELERYNSYLRSLQDRLERGNLDAIDAALRISQQRAKILGLYAPVEIHVQELVEVRVTEELTRFFNLIEETPYIPNNVRDVIWQLGDNLKKQLQPTTYEELAASEFEL